MKNRVIREMKQLWQSHRTKAPLFGALFFCLVLFTCSHSRESLVRVYKNEGRNDFKNGQIIGAESIYSTKERLFEKKLDELLAFRSEFELTKKALLDRLDKLEQQPERKPQGKKTEDATSEEKPQTPKKEDDEVRFGPPPGDLKAERIPSTTVGQSAANQYLGGHAKRFGPSVISFPVTAKDIETESGVVVPAGSYVKAKLMTGVEAPEGRTYPVLLQLDYAYIVPNNNKIDLSGCFMIAKSQGDLSTERVQMQATKISCVAKEGKMFEREINGFVADDKDNSFAVMGSVNSKQNRVAATAFLSSIVEGVGKALQKAQTTESKTPLGGSETIVTGDQLTHIGAGGAANAASLVTQWYLKQAQNLLPTINVGSGQDVWVVMAEKILLPNDYFDKNEGGKGDYSYFSRVLN